MKCPNCKEEIDRFDACDIYCSDCGSHAGFECPNCCHNWDSIWNTDIYDKIEEFNETVKEKK